MTKREQEQQHFMLNTLESLGFTYDEAQQLRRISMTLRRWFEHECNGNIQRDKEIGSSTEGKPFYWTSGRDGTPRKCGQVADRETGAINRLKGIIGQRNGRPVISNGTLSPRSKHTVSYYIQGDPRGAALYIIRPNDVPAGAEVGSYYSRGICVY